MNKAFVVVSSLLLCLMLNAQASTQKSVKPEKTAHKPAPQPNPIYQIDTTTGNFTVELFADVAPVTVKNFTDYIDSGFYVGTIFHRVIPGFVIQGGGFDAKMHQKKTEKPIKNESTNMLKNLKGTLSMARLSAPDTATSQFFINLKDNINLDKSATQKGYAVFGKVTNGMYVIEQLANRPTGKVGMYQDVPKTPVKITKITRIN
jgi:peptidyl-prolyl cis-trans isomerase A (cyclophilin A)